MTARQLIAAAETCVICGKIHKAHVTIKDGVRSESWAGSDGHAYRTRLFDMTNTGSGNIIHALRVMADE